MARTGRAQLALGLTLERGHDDNVLQLTRQNRDQFARRPGPPRFRIASIGDMATSGAGTLRWRGRLVDRRATRLGLAAAFDRYDRDRVFDWQQYEVSGAQELTATRRRLLTVDLSLSHIPRYYLGEIRDIDETVAAQRPNNNPIRHSLTYAQTAMGVRLTQ